MNTGLRAYYLNKVISLGSMAVLILGTLWALGYTMTQWQVILLCIVVFGYGHFLVGFYYQLKSFARKPDAKRYYVTFAMLVVFSVALTEVLFTYVGYALALFIGFLYFLLHGLFNEQTLLLRQSGIKVPLIYIASLAVFIMSLLTYTIPDQTFFFSRALEFISVDQFIIVQSFKVLGISISAFSQVFWFGMCLSLAILGAAWWLHRWHALTVFLALNYLIVIVLTVLFGALPYIYMYLIVVGYHFMTWFFFYVREMSRRGTAALSSFFGLHLIVLLPFVVAGATFFLSHAPPAWALTVLDYKYYIIATYVHITTSFMNDAWFQSLMHKTVTYFS